MEIYVEPPSRAGVPQTRKGPCEDATAASTNPRDDSHSRTLSPTVQQVRNDVLPTQNIKHLADSLWLPQPHLQAIQVGMPKQMQLALLFPPRESPTPSHVRRGRRPLLRGAVLQQAPGVSSSQGVATISGHCSAGPTSPVTDSRQSTGGYEGLRSRLPPMPALVRSSRLRSARHKATALPDSNTPASVDNSDSQLCQQSTWPDTVGEKSPTEKDLADFATQLKHKRAEMDLTPQALARQVDRLYNHSLSATTIRQFEARSLSRTSMRRVYRVLKVWTDSLDKKPPRTSAAGNRIQVNGEWRMKQGHFTANSERQLAAIGHEAEPVQSWILKRRYLQKKCAAVIEID